MKYIKQKAGIAKPYTSDSWAYLILDAEEFLAADSDARLVDVNGFFIAHGELRRRNIEHDWARFNNEANS